MYDNVLIRGPKCIAYVHIVLYVTGKEPGNLPRWLHFSCLDGATQIVNLSDYISTGIKPEIDPGLRNGRSGTVIVISTYTAIN